MPAPRLDAHTHTAPPPLGDPTSPVPLGIVPRAGVPSDDSTSAGSSRPPSPTSSDVSLSKEIPVVIEHASAASRSYPIGSVIAFIGALCLAHFVLVVGGVTGSNGLISRIVERL